MTWDAVRAKILRLGEGLTEPRVRAETVPERPVSIVVELPETLTRSAAEDARRLANRELSGVYGAPFSVLIDASRVRRADDDAMSVLAALEHDAGRSRFLVRLARVVKSSELARLANEDAEAHGASDVSKTFTRAEDARAFLAEVSA